MKAPLAPWLIALALSISPGCHPARPNVAERAAQAERDEGYPARYPRVDKTVRAERERAFRAKNPGPWLSVALDPYGFAIYVTRSDTGPSADASPDTWKRPPFTPEELSYYRDLLARNAEIFGIGDPAIVAGAGDATGIRIEQKFLGRPIANIEVGRYGPSRGGGHDEPGGTFIAGHLWPKIVEPRELLSDEEVASHVVGLPGTVVLGCTRHACDPLPGHPCPEPPPPVKAPHTVRLEDVRINQAQRVVHSQSGHGPAEVRALAAMELLKQKCPEAPRGCDGKPDSCPLSLTADLAGGRMGWAVDRATGEILRDPYVGASE